MSKYNFPHHKDRPLSWSAISCWEWSHEDWFNRYVLGKQDPPTPELKFGKIFANSCEIRKPLAPVTLLSKMEQEFRVMFSKQPLVGFADTFEEETKKETGEYKSGVSLWTQKKVDTHGQITMYALMNYITNKINPGDCKFWLEWIPTKKIEQENGDFSGDNYRIEFASNPPEVIRFNTRRSMADILKFGAEILKTVKEMKEYCKNHE
jgi:hypothetical protein